MSSIENSVMDTGPEWTDQDAQESIAQGWSIFSIVGREPETEAQLVNGKPYGTRFPISLKKSFKINHMYFL